MPRDMSTVRYRRVLEILGCLQRNGRASRSKLEEVGEYASVDRQNRTLQRDLQFLREELGAEIEYDPNDALWNEAYEYAYQRAQEEGDVDLDYDDELIHAWAEDYYRYQIEKR